MTRMNGLEFARTYTAEDYRRMANEIAETLTIRSYTETGSKDETRSTTKVEAEIISKIAIGAMDTFGYLNSNADAHEICNMAEFILMQFIPECNTYDTIYIPLMKCFGQW